MLTKENLVEKINRLPAELLKDPGEKVVLWAIGM